MSAAPNERNHAGQTERFLRLAAGFWSGETRVRAWILTVAVVFFILANLAAAIAFNRWNKFFFDSLEAKSTDAVIFGIGLVLAIALLSAVFSVGGLHARMRLQVRWRQWLAKALIARWLADRHYYQLSLVHTDAENPEARIAEDGRLAIELLVDFLVGVLNAVLAAISFIGILWVVGGALNLGGFSIPGYMVFACVIYSAITTVTVYLIGRPLVRSVEDKAAGEAEFRYELTRVKDNAENIALIGGDSDERERLSVTLTDVIHRWYGLIRWQGRMMWLTGANIVLSPVVPLLLGTPKYLAGEMTLGSLMQAATAFMNVQLALNWLADNALRIADWFASSHRVTHLSDAISRLEASLGPADQREAITLGASPDDRVHFRNLSIALHDGRLTIEGGDAEIAPGEKVLVRGEAGSGKSTLVHAMAGLWPWGRGEILRPEAAVISFMTQRPYFPLGTLRAVLDYPHSERTAPDDTVRDILMRCGLDRLVTRLDDADHWSSLLSDSEQQRLAFARVLIHRPDILIMDEPTSTLDELSQFLMMEYMRDLLPGTMVIHAGNRPGLERFHDREIRLVHEQKPAPARPQPRSRLDRVAQVLQKIERGRPGAK